jgi:hypothetical protein
MNVTIETVQNGLIFVGWIAAGWLLGAVITAVAIITSNYK